MAAAQRLMLKHNLDAVRTNAARDVRLRPPRPAHGRVGEHERLVAMILGKHFFVEAIWVPVYRPARGQARQRARDLRDAGEPRDRRVRPRLPARHGRAPLERAQARAAA